MAKKNPLARFEGNPIYAGIKDQLGIIIGLVLLCIFLSFMSPVFMSQRNFFNVLRQLSNNMFLSCGMLMVILLGGIDLSVGSTMAVTGCLVAGFMTNNGMPPMAAIVLALLVGLLIGVINGGIIASTGIPPFIITLAMMNIGRGFARLYTGSKTISIDNDFFAYIGTGYIGGVVPTQVVYMIVICLITALLLNKTKFGRNLYATGGNRQAAEFSGINTRFITFLVFVFSSLMASIAGIILASRMFSGTSTAGTSAEMDAIAAVVLGGTSMSGGVGGLFGTIIGVVLIAVLSNGMNLMGIDSSWQLVVKGIVIIIAVLIDYFKKAKAS
ncbi:ABC transporter permease [Breznakiella homolactica]|uniref:ABC transporter permease n=1 Tax=Breznakiella homolactica TaxID=2798577 RepID=A0A7T7XNF1_9SPIR|nr:ABC transporter permease [Breznakiella homolactica]QQO09442.1 ABC transporter permease [Breznakiella homolactica]